jgi:hypothetical protein
MPTQDRNFLASVSKRLIPAQERSESVVVIVDTESGHEGAKQPKRPWHAPKITDLGSRLDLDERVDGSSEGTN